MLPLRRGVRRITQPSPGTLRRMLSIQPTQSASSTISGQVRLGLPVDFFQAPTNSSGADAWCSSSQSRSSSGVSKKIAADDQEGIATVSVEAGQLGCLLALERLVAGQLPEAVDPVERRRMRREEAARSLLELLDRVREVHVLRRAVGDFEDLLVLRDLRERSLETVGIPRQLDRRRVGQVLALAVDRELDESGCDRGEDREDDRDDEHDRLEAAATTSIVVAGAATAPEREPQEEVGEEGDRSDEDADDQGEPDVEVPDVGELVANHALELLTVELLEEPGRDRDRCVLGITTGRERVRRGVVDNVDLRHGHVGGDRHLADDVQELRR